MRCLTLAEILRKNGHECDFISRNHKGNLNDYIESKGFTCHKLNVPKYIDSSLKGYEYWLGVSVDKDILDTKKILSGRDFNWLVIDHYAIDYKWECELKEYVENIFVIDDLADREHACNILLDQNFVRGMYKRYEGILPKDCVSFLGPKYAILRPEFLKFRLQSLSRRKFPKLERLLVFMGGSDADNQTSEVLQGIMLSSKIWDHIDIVVGKGFPHLDFIKEQLNMLPEAELHVQTPNMAKLMLNADLAITGGGSITWEKCVLGLPSFVVIQSDNQYETAVHMHNVGAQRNLPSLGKVNSSVIAKALDGVILNELAVMTDASKKICSRNGLDEIVKKMENF